MGGKDGLLGSVDSHELDGISGELSQIETRKELFDSNRKRLPKIRGLCELILVNFEDHVLRILLVAATVSLIVGIIKEGFHHGWIEGTAVYVAVAIIIAVTAGNDYMKEKQFQ